MSEGFLEFLDRSRLLCPVRKVRFPPSIHRRMFVETRHWAKPAPELEYEPDGERYDAAVDLVERLQDWAKPFPDPEWLHPLDAVRHEHRNFISTNPGSAPFTPWSEATRKAALCGNDIVSDSRFGELRFYHYYQVFILAEILDTGFRVIFDLSNQELAEALLKDQSTKGRGPCYRSLRLAGLRPLREAPQHLSVLNTIAFFVAYRQIAFQHLIAFRQHPSEQERRNEFNTVTKQLADGAIRRWAVSDDQLLAALRWECQRWGEWEERNTRLADEYTNNIRATVVLYRHMTGKNHDEVIADVGRVTGHVCPTLTLALPDATRDLAESATASIIRWTIPRLADLRNTKYGVSDNDAKEFVSWITDSGLLQILAHFGRINELLDDQDYLAACARRQEVTALALTIEQIIVHIAENTLNAARRSTWQPRGTLLPRMKWLWDGETYVHRALTEIWAQHTRTNLPLDKQLERIARVKRGGRLAPLVRCMLRAGLVRNYGSHGGLSAVDESTLISLFQHLIDATFLIWKRAAVDGLIVNPQQP